MLSSIAFAASIALLLALWVLAARGARRGDPIGATLQALAAAVPPLLLAGVLLSAQAHFGDLRVSLEGLRFRFDPTAPRTVRVGGAKEQDALVVPGLPPGFLTFTSQGGEIRLDLHPDAGPPADEDGGASRLAVGALRARPGTRPWTCRIWPCKDEPFFNSVALHEGDQVEVPGVAPLHFEADRPGLGGPGGPGGPGGQRPKLPSREGPLGFGIGRELPPELSIFPLRDLASSDFDRPVLGAGGKPLGGFAYRGGGYFRGGVFLALTEPGVRVVPKSGPPVEFHSTVATLRRGETLRLALFRIDFEEAAAPEAGPVGFWAHLLAGLKGGERLHPPSRAQERRSLRATFERDGFLRLDFDTPTYVQIEQSDLVELRRRARAEGGKALLSLAPERFALYAGAGEMLLSFAALGEPLGAELFSRIEPPAGSGAAQPIRVTTHSGVRAYPLGSAFPLGEDSAAIVRVARLGVPWGALPLAAAVALASALAGAPLRRRLLPFVVLTGMETLLAFRALIAYEGAYLDPASSASAWGSLATLALAPFAVQTALRLAARSESATGDRPDSAAGRFGGVTGIAYAAVALSAGAIALARAGVDPFSIVLVLGAALILPAIFGLWLLPRFARSFAATEGEPGKALRALLWVAGSLLVWRLLTLYGFGWKERIDLGPRFAVSILYVPWALLAMALAWRERQRWRGVASFWLLLGLFFALVPFLARDLGSILIFSLPPLLLFALPFFERPGVRNALLFLPLALAVLFYALLPAIPNWRPLPTYAEAREDPAKAEELVEKKVAVKRNDLRFWSRLAPEELKRVGTTEAEGFLTVMENLRAYAARGPLGRGYLAVPLSSPLAATHLNDNLSAVHLLGPFGWVGALALLLLFCGWIAASVAGAPAAPDLGALAPRAAWGLLLLWTLSLAALYMLSANVELLLFTGKNIYFLAASSLSDAVEGSLLVLLALWALAPTAPRVAPAVMEEQE
ncbi:MAG TPA: hypothetical protein VGS22_16085 [Thermoanaerobaculia bacterium]|jgi:hypothetical protein|nr:hypothetical protein [Thermoanaerobaculia bacterium]